MNGGTDAHYKSVGYSRRGTALNFILSGATALGVGRELIPKEAIRLRQSDRIVGSARRFFSFVNNGRIQAAARKDSIWSR